MIKPQLRLPSVERVRELFSYDPLTGLLVRKIAVPRAPVGSVAGTLNKWGRLICRVDYKIYYVHRIIWLIYYGESPPELIDHINGQVADNRICNLRLASPLENSWNRSFQRNNKTRIKGAHYSRIERKWKSSIKANGENIHLGYFLTKEAAGAAYAAAAAEYHGEFAFALSGRV